MPPNIKDLPPRQRVDWFAWKPASEALKTYPLASLTEQGVSLSVARDFVTAVQDKSAGQSVTKSVTPGQQVVKIVHRSPNQ